MDHHHLHADPAGSVRNAFEPQRDAEQFELQFAEFLQFIRSIRLAEPLAAIRLTGIVRFLGFFGQPGLTGQPGFVRGIFRVFRFFGFLGIIGFFLAGWKLRRWHGNHCWGTASLAFGRNGWPGRRRPRRAVRGFPG